MSYLLDERGDNRGFRSIGITLDDLNNNMSILIYSRHAPSENVRYTHNKTEQRIMT